jgi:hypothetical protein
MDHNNQRHSRSPSSPTEREWERYGVAANTTPYMAEPKVEYAQAFGGVPRQHIDSYSSAGGPSHYEEQAQQLMGVAHVGFTDALIAQKPSPWTKTMFKLYFFLFVAFLNSCINGYDGSLMGGINAMTQYQA